MGIFTSEVVYLKEIWSLLTARRLVSVFNWTFSFLAYLLCLKLTECMHSILQHNQVHFVAHVVYVPCVQIVVDNKGKVVFITSEFQSCVISVKLLTVQHFTFSVIFFRWQFYFLFSIYYKYILDTASKGIHNEKHLNTSAIWTS